MLVSAHGPPASARSSFSSVCGGGRTGRGAESRQGWPVLGVQAAEPGVRVVTGGGEHHGLPDGGRIMDPCRPRR